MNACEQIRQLKLQSDLVYPNYVSSNNVSLAGYPEIEIRPVATVSIRGQSPLNFLCPSKFCYAQKMFL